MKKIVSQFLSTGEFLRKARLAANLSQADVRKTLDYQSPQIISDWERGVCRAPTRVLPTLVKIYKFDANEFIEIYLKAYEIELKYWINRRPKKKKVLRETQDHKLRS